MKKFISLIVVASCFLISACEQKSTPSFIVGTYENNDSSSLKFSEDGVVISATNGHAHSPAKYYIENNEIKGKDGYILNLVIQPDGSLVSTVEGRFVKK